MPMRAPLKGGHGAPGVAGHLCNTTHAWCRGRPLRPPEGLIRPGPHCTAPLQSHLQGCVGHTRFITAARSSSQDVEAHSHGASFSPKVQSSWSAVEKGGGRGGGADYLYELGQSDYNTNVDAGQNVSMIDSLFTGNTLGHKTDIADGTLRGYEFRSLAHIVGDYYVSPKFMNKVVQFIAKNYLMDAGSLPASCKVPLILGIWGPKGCGKSFQTELVFKKLGLEPIIMSAGELESEIAGSPGKLIRERYKRASEMSKARGKLTCLLINDLDAGIGRFGNTQTTVNNQIVVGTLMNLCDDPHTVSIGGDWTVTKLRRTPIIVTGNDFSTLYAPLVRDGRMEKFYWEPDLEDIVAIVYQMYEDDGITRADVSTLVRRFGSQPLDFFGALRAAAYDNQIRDWVRSVAGASFERDEANMKEVSDRLLRGKDLPDLQPLQLTLDMLIAEGNRLVAEQDAINASKLSEEYMKTLKSAKSKKWGSLVGLMG